MWAYTIIENEVLIFNLFDGRYVVQTFDEYPELCAKTIVRLMKSGRIEYKDLI